MFRSIRGGLCFVVGCLGARAAASELNLNAAIAGALEQNFEIRIESLNSSIAGDELAVERGEFLPFFYSDWRRNSLQQYQNSIDFTSRNGIRRWEEDNWNSKSGVGGKLPTGTSYEFYYSLYSTRNSLNATAPSANALFRPEVETFAGFKLSQSLLRNFGWKVNTAGIRISRIQILVNDLRREVLINNKALEVANAFYDLVFTRNDQQVKSEALEISRQFLGLTREQVSVGKAADIDIAQAEVNVSEAKERWVLASNAYRRSLVALVKVMGGTIDANAELPDYVLPDIVLPPPANMNVATLIASAHAHRADLRAAENEAQQTQVRSLYASNQRLPELNVEFSYGLNGFGDSAQDSFGTLRDLTEPAWTVGLLFRVPIGNMKEASRVRIARKRTEQAELTAAMRRSQIGLEVRNAVDRITVFRERREIAAQSVAFARKALEVERARYSNGRTSSFTVLEMQDRLAAARTRELAATVDLIKASEELQAVTGVLLPYHGFQIERTSAVPGSAATASPPTGLRPTATAGAKR